MSEETPNWMSNLTDDERQQFRDNFGRKRGRSFFDNSQNKIGYDRLYLLCNELCTKIGAEGQVTLVSDDALIEKMMDALYDIDGGAPPKGGE